MIIKKIIADCEKDMPGDKVVTCMDWKTKVKIIFVSFTLVFNFRKELISDL